MFRIGNLKLPHKKHTADMKDARISTPNTVVLPMSQYIGAPALPIVKVGQQVCVGTKVAEADGKVSAAIHSPVSGIVKKIGDFLLANGKSCQAITIESDGKMTLDPGITPPVVNSAEDLCQAIRESGLVGLGGAGFPTANKLENAINKKIDMIIVNGAECEPYITIDNRTMIDGAEYVARGVKLIEKFIPGPQQIVIAIEENKPDAIAKLTALLKDDPKVRIEVLPSIYPQGAEKILIYNLTGRVVPEGKLPSDVGCVMFNVTSVAFMAHYLETGIPFVWKTVTVDGSAVKSPKNVTAPIGTSLRDILTFADADFNNLGKVLYGGPMMGIAAYNLDDPIYKNTSAVIALNKADSLPKTQYPCIHCGKCIQNCPVGLNPTAFVKAMNISDKNDRAAMLEKASVLSCIDCGCCSYVCPSRRPLVENNKLAKADLRKTLASKNN
ncbi:MAG: electron transport complex subunit RsxC [Clostridia bacterium]|nr:electron transport complex subunit RsxC [Clostridia bacterium]